MKTITESITLMVMCIVVALFCLETISGLNQKTKKMKWRPISELEPETFDKIMDGYNQLISNYE